MEAKKYTIQNQAKDTSISSGVAVINSALEPLAALRVMVEGLESGNEAGLWLTHVTVIPMVPRISPFDLVYLDKDDRVVERIELLPATEIPRFKKPSASALVLPFRTISSAKIEPGDQFSFQEISEEKVAATVDAESENNTQAAASRTVSTQPNAPSKVEPSIHTPALETQQAGHEDFESSMPFLASATPVSQDDDAESPGDVQDLTAVPMTPIFGSWFRNEQEALRQAQQEPPQTLVPTESKEPEPVEATAAIVQFLKKPEAATHWTKATLVPDAVEPEIAILPETPLPAQRLETPQLALPVKATPKISVEPPPSDRSIHLEPARSRREEASAPPDPQEKKPIGSRFFRWLYPSLYDQNRRGSERRPSPGLVAYDLSSGTPRMHEVDNISSTGIYLRTNGRWEPGSLVSLILQRSGPFEEDQQQRIELEAGAVRAGDNGIGLSFVLPPGMDLNLWEMPERKGVYEARPDAMVRELRLARALAFLRRICPPAADEIKEMLHKTLSSVRVANAVEIAFKAERLLANEPNAHAMVAHPGLIVRILEHGTWVDVEWIQELWAGLLATSCTFEGQDESNLVFINLLSRMAPLPTQILTAACAKATKAMAQSASVSPYLLAISAEEMAKITRSNNLNKIYRSISELSELGLLENSSRSSSHETPETAKAKPTHLGLQMYARCNGHRGAA